MGTTNLLSSLHGGLDPGEMEESSFSERLKREDTKKKWLFCFSHNCQRSCFCCRERKKNEDSDCSFISQEYSSGESEPEEDMINYIDKRKPYVSFGQISEKEQVDRLFFMW